VAGDARRRNGIFSHFLPLPVGIRMTTAREPIGFMVAKAGGK